jgi:tripartite ATP-independent transporter DctP family solute receptor
MRKTTLSLVAAVTLVVTSWSVAAEQITARYSGIQAVNHPATYSEQFFGEMVETLTEGSVKVETFANAQLGDAVANVQSVRNGTIGFTTVPASNLSQVVPQMDMFTLPFLFRNAAHFWWFLSTPEAAEFVKPLEEKGIKLIAYIDSGARNFFGDRPIRTPADLKGMKVRVMASPVAVKMMEAMGGTGTPVAWSELYTALQTGVVDGAENNHPSIVTKKFYEVSKYYTIDEHARIPDMMIMSMKLYSRLDDKQKAAIVQAGQLAQAYMRGAWKISDEESFEDLKSKFKEVITVEKQPFIDSVAPMVKTEAARLNVEKIVAFIIESGKRFQK